jgi:hypothetical protein
MMISVEGYDEEDVALRMKRIDDVCKKHGGVDGGPDAAMFAKVGMTEKRSE